MGKNDEIDHLSGWVIGTLLGIVFEMEREI
jgi:hypothetical protein